MCVCGSELEDVRNKIKKWEDMLELKNLDVDPSERVALQTHITSLQNKENMLLTVELGGRHVLQMLQCLCTCIYYIMTADWMRAHARTHTHTHTHTRTHTHAHTQNRVPPPFSISALIYMHKRKLKIQGDAKRGYCKTEAVTHIGEIPVSNALHKTCEA